VITRSRTAVAAAVAMLAFAAPAAAMPTGAGVRAGHNISVFATIDFIGAFGYSVGTPMTVEVLRNGHSIASVTAPTHATPDGGGLEVNHGPLGAPQPGDCWEGFTPDVRAGDVVRVTADGGIDEVMVDNIRIDQGPTETAPGSGIFEMRGIAARGDGTPIPVAELDSGELRNTSKFRVMPNEVTRTGTPDGWLATYHAPFNVTRNGTGADPLFAIPTVNVIGMGYGHVVPLPAETQLADGVGDLPGPALGCEISPASDSGFGSVSTKRINIASLGGVGAGDTALSVGGLATPSTGSATIQLSDGTKTIEKPAEGLAGGASQPQGFTARFTRAEVESLADGTLTLSGALGGAGTATRTVVKDTVAPTIASSLAPGSYTGDQRVLLDVVGADKVTYRTDGRPAGPGDFIYLNAPITLPPGERTLTVLAVDNAGNETRASYAYSIRDRAGAAPAPAPIAAPLAKVAIKAPSSRSLRVGSVRVQKKLRRAVAKRKGVLVKMRLAAGTRMVRISLYRRLGHGGYDLVGRLLRVPGKGGSYSVRMNDAKVRRALRKGSYTVEVAPGGSSGRISEADARTASFRVV
jgi:hypothetical protein